MNYFISDLHLCHENVIKMCSRPFSSLAEMNAALVGNWNARVKSEDNVYIVGDLIFGKVEPAEILSALNGRKILIVGNHDKQWLKRGDYSQYFEQITPYLETKIDGRPITLCHYPMVEWANSRKLGSVKKLGFHIHGHIHNGTDAEYRCLFVTPHALNAGADINGFTPVTFEELERNNEAFKLSALSPVDKALFLAGKYHMYQTDKSGKPYVNHPKAVAAQLDGEDEKIVGYLHDTLEDTDIDIELLEKHFSQNVINAVVTMTHDKSEDYFDYIARVKTNPIARKVKLADLTHNMDLSRIKAPTEHDLLRLEKYKKAYAILSE